MRTVLLLLFVACAAPKPLVAPTCPPVAPAPAAPVAPTKPDEAAIKARSHQLFDAFDRADAAAFADLTGPTFGLYEDERYMSRDLVLGGFKNRIEKHAPIHSREWESEQVFADPYVAVFIGEATEHVPSGGPTGPISDQGANTLVWVH